MAKAQIVENVRDIAPDLMLEGIAERLRLAREHAGLSQDAFANAIGSSRRQIIAWEKGQNSPPVKVFAKLREICNVDPEWVLSGPGLIPLEEVTPDDRDRTKRVVKNIDKLAKGYGLELPQEALEDLARVVLQEPAELEDDAIRKLATTIRALARGKH